MREQSSQKPQKKNRSVATARPAPTLKQMPSQALARPEALLKWQQLVGNQVVARAATGHAPGRTADLRHVSATQIMRENGEEEAPANLREALGFRSKLEIADHPIMARGHPLTVALVKGTKGALEAKLVEQDGEASTRHYLELRRLTGNLRTTMRRLGDQAPHRFLWSMEEMAWGHVLSRVESGFYRARLGLWSEGMDDHWFEMINALDRRLIQGFMFQQAQVSREISPGGKFKQRLPLGVFPVPGGVINVYLVLEGEKKGSTVRQAEEGGAASGGAAAEVDEKGNLKGNVSVGVEGEGGSKVTGEVGAGGAAVSGQTGKVEAGGASAQGSAKLSGEGAEAGLAVADPKGWTTEVKMTSGGALSYQLAHPKAGGISISGEIGKTTLQLMAPEITSGDYTFKFSVEVVVIPAPHLWPESLTQTANMVRYANIYYGTLTVLAALPAGIALSLGAAEAGAVALSQLPRVLIRFPAAALAPA